MARLQTRRQWNPCEMGNLLEKQFQRCVAPSSPLRILSNRITASSLREAHLTQHSILHEGHRASASVLAYQEIKLTCCLPGKR